jgi:hypothetical protein
MCSGWGSRVGLAAGGNGCPVELVWKSRLASLALGFGESEHTQTFQVAKLFLKTASKVELLFGM